jgi:hypothetical protein
MLGQMELSEVYRSMGRERFDELIGEVSMGSLRTYKLVDSFKVHTRVGKLNREHLRKATPHLWERLQQGDEELARELAQGVLVSNLDFVVEVLDFLEIPHDGAGFFDKEGTAAAEKLTEGWQKRVFDEFHPRYPESLVLLYVNHLDWELAKPSTPFVV